MLLLFECNKGTCHVNYALLINISRQPIKNEWGGGCVSKTQVLAPHGQTSLGSVLSSFTWSSATSTQTPRETAENAWNPRVLQEKESGRTLVEPLCLCSEWQLYTEDGVHGWESQQEAAHHDCIFQALTFSLLIHRGITQGQGHASDSAFLGKTFLLW